MTFARGLFGAALLAVSLSAPALAQQDYPNRPITWVVPFAPGGVTDNAARFTAKSLGERLGQPIIVETKPGHRPGPSRLRLWINDRTPPRISQVPRSVGRSAGELTVQPAELA